MSVIGSNVLAGASGSGAAGEFQIDRSLRFNSADSANLSKVFSAAGNTKTWTLSAWVKFNTISSSQTIFNSANGSNFHSLYLRTDGTLKWDDVVGGSDVQLNKITNQVFRDFSAWYHIVLAVDTTQSTAADRNKMYVNGVQSSFASGNDFSQNDISQFNQGSSFTHNIGSGYNATYANAYLADVHFIDGQALAPTDFGEYDDNNVWQPKEFTGSYASDPLYSSYATNPSSFNGSAHNLFDGDLTTSWQNTDTSGSTYASVDLTQGGAVSGIAFTTSFEMYGAFSYNQVLEIDHAGGTHTYNGNPGGSGAWIDFASSLTSPVTAIRFKDSGGTGTPSWNAIRVDNTILTEFGVNSFHLDFSDNSSNAALGTDSSGNSNTWTVNNIQTGSNPVYSDNLTTNGGTSWFGGAAVNAFDGATNTFVQGALGQDVTFAPATSIPVTTSLKIWADSGSGSGVGNGPYQIIYNGTTIYNGTMWTSPYTITAAVGTSLSTLVIDTTPTGEAMRLFAIEVDGTILVNGAGAGEDSLIDTPTNYEAASGNNGGNYATWNPLDKDNTVSYANGNLEAAVNAGSTNSTYGTVSISSGKWYWEVVISGGNGSSSMIGVAESNKGTARRWTGANGWYYYETGVLYNNLASTSYGASYTNGDVIGVALDMDNGNLVFYKNGSSQGTAYSTGTFSGKKIMPAIGNGGGANVTYTVNFGQRPFAYTPPTGHLSLCTQNLPDPTIADGSDYFDVITYTGDGNSTRTISNIGFSPDLVWTKARNQAYGQNWYDIVRTAGKVLRSDLTDAEATNHEHGYLSAFNSDGYTMSSGTTSSKNGNELNTTYVAWTWDGGTSTVSNTDGSITSNVRANASAGFSIVSYTGTGSNATVGHGLNDVPGLIIIKNRDEVKNWVVGHSALATGNSLRLNLTNAVDTAATIFNSTDPTSSVFSVGTNISVNGSADKIIAYCFAPVEGYSAFGSYTGNGSADGPFVYTGFRPRWVMVKVSSTTNSWVIIDSERDSYNIAGQRLRADLSNAENTQDAVDFLSNGFKVRSATASAWNDSGQTYIYACLCEHPFKTARAR